MIIYGNNIVNFNAWSTICVNNRWIANSICPGVQHMTLMCSTNHIYLEWNVSTIRQPSLRIHETRSIPYLDQNIAVSPILINSVSFTFSRVSSPGELPLMSTMIINNVTSNLEGTVISCTGLNSSSVSSVVLMTAIHIYDINGRSCLSSHGIQY